MLSVEKSKYVTEVNVDFYLHKPLPKKDYKSVKEKINDIYNLDLLEEHQQVHNDVVDAGEIWITELLANRGNTGAALPSWLVNGLRGSSPVAASDRAVIAVGTGGIATAQNDFKLTLWKDEVECETVFDGTDKNKIVVSGTFATGQGNGALIEAGIFARRCDANDDGTKDQEPDATDKELDVTINRMFNRSFFSVITKTSSFELTIQWTITIGVLTPP